jgi:hypothetical protein
MGRAKSSDESFPARLTLGLVKGEGRRSAQFTPVIHHHPITVLSFRVGSVLGNREHRYVQPQSG